MKVQWHQPFLSVSLSLLPKFLQSSIYVVRRLGLNLIKLINCCFKSFRMVLLSPFLNGIKMGDHWTLKKQFLTTSITTSLMTVSIHSLGASIIPPTL